MQRPPHVSYPSRPPLMRLSQLPFHFLMRCLLPCPLHLQSLPPSLSLSPRQPLTFEEEPPPLTQIPPLSSLVSPTALGVVFVVGSVRREVTRKAIVPRNSRMKGPQGGLRPSLMCNVMGGMTYWTKRIMGGTSAQDVGLTSVPPLRFAGATAPRLRRKRGSKTLLIRVPSTMRGMRQTTMSKSVEATLG